MNILCYIILCFLGERMPNQADLYVRERELMVKTQIEARNIRDKEVLKALREVPRHLFVPENIRYLAYNDSALPIGYGQTISQPYIVSFMSEAARIKSTDRVLEIGTGCGYQAAILSKLCQEVYTIEIVEPLAREAQSVIKQLGYTNIKVRIGNGYEGWAEAAPFDAIIATASPEHIPRALLNQLKLGGRLIIPVGEFGQQDLLRITKTEAGMEEEYLLPVRFVPMTGKEQKTH
ncbi:protein-L-isoaspartate(D-aspartate) O-methyltransferase [Candidatus Odyssella thessalonicensis]|uniref:protein-L-isoaspartate(D-aspartate) O-methyltransferase n=1 Tax=Candidatus Odyssella thessalonicensis TaxID=84647 RepID=UPI000225AC6B